MNKLNIFVSYGHDEYVAYARKVAEELKVRGHDVWFDEDKLKPGPAWEEYIENGLEKVIASGDDGRMLYIMTPHSVRRPDGYCLSELAKALDNNVFIIPIMLAPVIPPLSIYRLQYLDVTISQGEIELQDTFTSDFTKICSALESVNYLDKEGVMARLINELEPISFTSEIKYHQPQFVGREWVFDDIRTWLNDKSSSRLFLLTGMPGIGKTAIATQLIQNFPEIAAFYLCKRGDSQKSSAHRVITTIAYQLSAQIPEYRELLLRKDIKNEIGRCLDSISLYDVLIQQPLSAIHNDYEKVILIDALDEATSGDNNDIAELIGCEFERLPKWIKVIVTCRPNESCLDFLQEQEPWQLQSKSDGNSADIRLYVEKRLCDKYSIDDINKIVEFLILKSESTFLYVECMCNDILSSKIQNIFDRDSYPLGMSGFYLKYFKHKFPNKTNYRERIAPVLEIMLAAYEPLTIDEIKAILGWNNYQMNDFLSEMGAFIAETSDHKLIPFHASLCDWLENKNRDNKIYAADKSIGANFIFNFINCLFDNELSHLIHQDEYLSTLNILEKTYKIDIDRMFKCYLQTTLFLSKYKEWCKFSCWYKVNKPINTSILELMHKFESDYFALLCHLPEYKEYTFLYYNRVRNLVSEMMQLASRASQDKITSYLYHISLYLSASIKLNYNTSMIEMYCDLTRKAFPNMRFITSNFVQDEPLAGCFAERICCLFYDIVKQDKINSTEILEWLEPVVKYKEKSM